MPVHSFTFRKKKKKKRQVKKKKKTSKKKTKPKRTLYHSHSKGYAKPEIREKMSIA